ncbi:hypothetical protein MNB_SV-14-1126 [hydrothermal vent metagenome]|uniref:Uncharacterized protein n=1 Tax=hydrothermal vent metagenome TaxID=652676 RepID=A0A1W1C185_9ZZZZ
MKTRNLLFSSLAMILSTTFIHANIEIDVVSHAVPITPDHKTVQMCIQDYFIHFEAIGESNNTDGEIPSWTVGDDTYAYGDTFYFVPPTTTVATYTVRLYDGMVKNDTVDNQGAPKADEVYVNVIDCN